ncbi:MAG: hypothetical protein ACI3XW_05805, partial [Butyricicoccus sp.]
HILKPVSVVYLRLRAFLCPFFICKSIFAEIRSQLYTSSFVTKMGSNKGMKNEAALPAASLHSCINQMVYPVISLTAHSAAT